MIALPSARTRWVRIATSLFLALLLLAQQGTAQAQGLADVTRQDSGSGHGIVSSPTPSPEAPVGDTSDEPSPTPEAAKLVATYLVSVSGPNLTGKVPPLDKSRAIASQVGVVTIAADYVPGQWYDHYAYYTLDGTEVEQYTNFQETGEGQYIHLQGWRNHNGGPDRYLQESRTGSSHNWIYRWLSSGPTLVPDTLYAEGYGTLLASYFQASDYGCPCWSAEYTVGSH